MSEPFQTDTFFYTKHNQPNQPNPAMRSMHSISLSKAQAKKQQIQELYNNYNLFKYSKVFIPKRRLSLKEPPKTERDSNLHNFKAIKRESDKLKERLVCMQQQRKILLERLRGSR